MQNLQIYDGLDSDHATFYNYMEDIYENIPYETLNLLQYLKGFGPCHFLQLHGGYLGKYVKGFSTLRNFFLIQIFVISISCIF